MIKCDSQIKEDEKVYAIISFFEKTSSKRRDMILVVNGEPLNYVF